MTDQTAFDLPVKLRRCVLLLFQSIENPAKLWIDRCELQYGPALHPTHIDIVIEINGARRLDGNMVDLKTRLRKHQRLRRLRNFQFPKNRRKVTPAAVKL